LRFQSLLQKNQISLDTSISSQRNRKVVCCWELSFYDLWQLEQASASKSVIVAGGGSGGSGGSGGGSSSSMSHILSSTVSIAGVLMRGD
jgi:hypothetical protein